MFHFDKIVFYFSDAHKIPCFCCQKSFVMAKGLLLLFLLIGNVAFCQMGQSKTPQYQNMQPAYGTAPNSTSSAPQYQQIGTPVQMGATAGDVTRQSENNANRFNATYAEKQKEIQNLIRENQLNPRRHISDEQYRKDSTANSIAIKGFFPALKHLQDMLEGRTKLSVADAYYTLESAYGNCYLTHKQYDDIIRQSADFIRNWMQENGLDMRDNYQVQTAIQRFMSEQLTVTRKTKQNDRADKLTTINHQPFYYDYDDYQYTKDYRNCFLTKCLATGFGQCNSMPAVYLVLAEQLGVKAYLTFVPNHSFVKYPDNKGKIVNYEPTSNWEISDKWYIDNMFIRGEAIASGVYLDTFNTQQVVANCIFDLAVEYMRVDRSLNEDFVNASMRTAIPYFPKNNNLESLFIYSMHLKTELREEMQRYGISDINQIGKVPQAMAIYKEYLGNEAYITKLGYQDMPAGMYEEMMNQHEFKGRVQKNLQVNGKEKRNLFVTVNN
jgi:hypothetical protein